MKRFFKSIGIGILGAGVIGAAAYSIAIRNTPASHDTLKNADLAPLIPVRAFFADTSSSWGYGLSAEARYRSHFESRRAKDTLVISDRESGKELLALKDIKHYVWAGHGDMLHVFREGRFWRIDPTSPDEDTWQDVTPRGFQRWNILDMPSEPDAPFFITSNDRNPAFHDVYTTRQDGGGKELLIENEGQTLSWLLDKSGAAVMRLDRSEDGEMTEIRAPQTFEDATTTWALLDSFDAYQTFWPIEVDHTGEAVFALSSRGRDKVALVRMGLSDGSEVVLFEEQGTDLGRVLNVDPHDGMIDAVVSHAPGAKITAFSDIGQVFQGYVEEVGGGLPVDIDGWREAGTLGSMGLALSPDAKGYEFYTFDISNGRVDHVATHSFRARFKDHLVSTEHVSIPARDGLTIPALLMRPSGVSGPVPLVVDVHGGPAHFYTWQYHHLRQFLVNRGYAVLAVNFRGSTGFGKAFQAAGFGEPGRAMQTDIYDAALWAAEQGIADPDKMAVWGGSYGGYSAAFAATDPDSPFAAAVIEHAVLDVEYQMRNNPFAWGLSEFMLERYWGTLEENVEQMRAVSPITHVSEMQSPALIIAGKRDQIVGFEQSEEFIKAAEAAGKDVETLIFEEAGHGLHRWQDRVIHARALEDFLAEHLGGRSGGWDAAEVAARWLD